MAAVVAARPVLRWLEQRRVVTVPRFNLKRAAEHREAAVEICQIIPKDDELCRLQRLMESAERDPAPEAWAHLAIGAMLMSYPSARDVHDAFRCAIVDGAYRDPDLWGDYEPGFSVPVFIAGIRKTRMLGDLPPPGKFLNLCQKARAQFRRWHEDFYDLMQIRCDAEDVLIKLDDGRVKELCCWAAEEDPE
jgi:hypothetical protein